MGAYEDMLRKLGLEHLKDDPEALQEAILKELGMQDLKGDHEAIMERSEKMLRSRQKEFERAKEELGELIQKGQLKRNN